MMTWEQTVLWLRKQDQYRQLIHWGYLDEPLVLAAKRFAESDEWNAVRELVLTRGGRKALDIGAGRGVASYALAMDGWDVTAVEPDRSAVVGAEAISKLARECNLSITVISTVAETLPFPDRTFDLVYGRQVFHHIADMSAACREAFRVLKPGGQMLIVREHVISRQSDLPHFLANHSTHRLCGGETARMESEYVAAIEGAGFELAAVFRSWDSVINYYPASREDWRCECIKYLHLVMGWRLALGLANPRHAVGRWLLAGLARSASRRDHCPGRMFSFVAEKKVNGVA